MSFPVRIITPKGIYASLEVDSLTIKLTSGYRTFLKGHMPLIGALDYAPMHYIENGEVKYFAVHGGAINVKEEEVVIIVNIIEAAEDIDVARAESARKRAEDRLQSKDINIDIKRAELALKKSLVRLETANKR